MDRRRARARQTGTSRTLSEWLPYWENELGARDCREATFVVHGKAFKKLIGGVGDVAAESLTPATVEGWRDRMSNVERLKPGTVNNYLRWVGTFYNWLVDEGVVSESPIAQVAYVRSRDGASEPRVYDAPLVRSMIAGASTQKNGRGKFEALRNEAVLSLLADTGMRAGEVAGLLAENVNLPARQLLIHAEITKGRRDRTVVFGFQTAKVLARYLRAREAHAFAFAPQLFLGRKGPMAYWGIYEIVKTAGRDEGIIGAHPHLLRHTWAHSMKDAGVSDEVLMSLGGWRSPAMVARYGRAEKTARALEAARRVGSPLDRASVASRQSKGGGRRRSA